MIKYQEVVRIDMEFGHSFVEVPWHNQALNGAPVAAVAARMDYGSQLMGR